MTLEDQQFKKWLRRPTEFIACTWFLMAAAGQYIVPYLVLAVEQLLSLFSLRMTDAAFIYASSALSEVGLFFLPVVLYAASHDGVVQSMRLNIPRWDALLIAALAAPIGVFASDKLSTWWMMLIEALGGSLTASSVPIPTTLPELALALILTAVLPGICEETLFRGGLMGAWERRGTKQALVITSVLFALLHGSVMGLPVQLIMGFVLGYLVIQSDSLVVGMVYHIIHNATILLLTYISPDSAGLGGQFMTLTKTVLGTVGVFGLLVQTVIWIALYGGMLALFIRSQKKRGVQFDKIIEGDKEPMSWETLVVLLAGILTVCVTFMSDLMTVCSVF